MSKNRKPLIPMGAITGHPSRCDLRTYLTRFHEAGIEQFYIYPRSGLEVEYMGPEWLEICRHIIEYCAEHEMAAWIYDEYNWPSGKCKGKVIKANPDFASKKLVAFTDLNFCGRSGYTASNREYYWSEMSIPLYADTLNPDAMDCFISLTHEVYYQHFSEYFGTTIKGIFTDEPSLRYATLRYASTQPIDGCVLELPYYDGMKEDYRKHSGYELIDELEAYLRHESRKEMFYDIFTVLGKRFKQAYMDKMREWCQAHNVHFVGHLMNEDYPPPAILSNGKPVDIMKSFSMPGIDEINTKTAFETIIWETFKLVESATDAPDTDAIAEVFAHGPSNMSFEKIRQMIFLSAIHGINHYLMAISALDARGNVEKALFYSSFTAAQPWFKYTYLLNESAAEAAGLTRKTSTAIIALRYPQRQVCESWDAGNPNNYDKVVKIVYSDLIRAFINAQWEFRVIGDDEKAGANYQAVFDLNLQGAHEERTGTDFNNIAGILAFLENKFSRRVSLRYRDGKLAEKVLLKSYDDGSACVVNCTPQSHLRELTLGGEFFDLPPHGVKIIPEQTEPRLEKMLDLKTSPMTMTLADVNTMRCSFPSSLELRIELERDTELKLILREYHESAKVLLDGQAIEACNPCAELPVGLRQLYKETEILNLRKGAHYLRLVSKAEDLPYLPLAFIAGHFGLGKDKTIRALPEHPELVETCFTQYLTEYCGNVVFLLDNVDLTDYDGIAFEHQSMAVELSIDSNSLGPILWAPFVWQIPDDLRKADCKLEVSISTSVGPLFGLYPEHLESESMPLQKFKRFWPGSTTLPEYR